MKLTDNVYILPSNYWRRYAARLSDPVRFIWLKSTRFRHYSCLNEGYHSFKTPISHKLCKHPRVDGTLNN